MLATIIELISNHVIARNLAMTVALLIAAVLLHWLAGRSLQRATIKSVDLRRRWMVQVRNFCIAFFVIGAMTIWASELRAFVFSVAAVLVALVLATKELILCFMGGLLKVSTGAFVVGDRIEINGIRGEVVDQTLLATKVMEIGPGQLTHQFTGRSVTLPNSLLLSASVFNENLVDDFVIHVMTFPVKVEEDCQQLVEQLEAIAHAVCGKHLEPARQKLARLTRKKGLDTPSIDPRVSLEFPDPDSVNLLLRVPMPSQGKGLTERDIRYRFLEARKALMPEGRLRELAEAQ